MPDLTTLLSQFLNALYAGTYSFPAKLSASVSGLANVSTDGMVVQNTTDATAAVPLQFSPRLRFRASAWNTTAVAAANTDDWWLETVPTSGTIPGTTLRIQSSRNGGTAVTVLQLTASAAANYFTTMQATGYLAWTGRGLINSPGDGQINLTITAANVGIGLDAATDAVLKVRTRAQSGYATVDALGYRVSGAAGATFGPGAVTSITVVNGLITAIS